MGFGPGGVAIRVDTLTDNEKRAFSAVRAAFTHHGGKIGNSGSAAFNFVQMGVISFDSDKTAEEIEDDLILNDVESPVIMTGEPLKYTKAYKGSNISVKIFNPLNKEVFDKTANILII